MITAWQDLMADLAAFARLQPELEGVTILEGAPAAWPEMPGIILMHDRTLELTIYNQGAGRDQFIAELWVTSDDPDPAVCLGTMATLEANFLGVLVRWATQGKTVAGADVIEVGIANVIGDLDEHRPHVAERVVFTVQWSKRWTT